MKSKGSITPLTRTQRFFVAILGVAFIAAGIYMYADMSNFGKGIRKTEGIIVGVQKEQKTEHSGSRRYTHVTYRPVVEFAVGEKKYKFLAKAASDFYKVDQKIRVNYDPKNPSQFARLAGKKELLVPVVCAVFGVIALLLAFLAPSKKQQHTTPNGNHRSSL